MEIQQFFTLIAEQIQSQAPLDWAITLTSLAYIWLAAKERPICWLFGIVSSGLWAWASFFRYNLWVDGYLQLFYVAMGFWGLYAWQSGRQPSQKLHLQQWPLRAHFFLILAGLALTLAFGFLFKSYTPTSFPYADAFITAFSVIATVLTIRKVVEGWLYWIFFDALAVVLFWAKDAFLLAFVMVVYTLMAGYAWRQWGGSFEFRVSSFEFRVGRPNSKLKTRNS
jgi:nicotinamide mononucleotide transporter